MCFSRDLALYHQKRFLQNFTYIKDDGTVHNIITSDFDKSTCTSHTYNLDCETLRLRKCQESLDKNLK